MCQVNNVMLSLFLLIGTYTYYIFLQIVYIQNTRGLELKLSEFLKMVNKRTVCSFKSYSNSSQHFATHGVVMVISTQIVNKRYRMNIHCIIYNNEAGRVCRYARHENEYCSCTFYATMQ